MLLGEGDGDGRISAAVNQSLDWGEQKVMEEIENS